MVTSILHGIALPLMSIVYGSMTDLFVDSSYLENILNLIMPNITEKFPNATTEKIIDNIGTIMLVSAYYHYDLTLNTCMLYWLVKISVREGETNSRWNMHKAETIKKKLILITHFLIYLLIN